MRVTDYDMNESVAIRTQNLTKTFGSNVAVNALNLEVKER